MINLVETGTARVRKAVFKDIGIIAENMRQSDIDEVWASDRLIPTEALERSYEDSVLCLTIEYQGRPIGMFGIVPFTLEGRKACVWLLGTNDLSKVNRKLVRRSKEFIDIMLSYYPYLTNFVSCSNDDSVRWLKFCGAKFYTPAPHGVDGRLFQRFEFIKDDYANR